MALDAQAGDEEGTLAAKHIAKAEAFREAGKVHFQAGNYRAALAEYHQIYLYVNGFSAKGASADKASGLPSSASQPSVTEDEMVRINELKFVHFSNVALCLMKLGNAAKSVTYSTKALALDPNNVKCLFRRGKCRLDVGDLDGAREDLRAVLRLDSGNREAQVELRRLKELAVAHDRDAAKKFSKMFSQPVPQPAATASAAAAAAAPAPAAADGTG